MLESLCDCTSKDMDRLVGRMGVGGADFITSIT